ncbi:hypothetical protein [Dolichospermum compactum]|uniref:Uncharacterized protein n=1 Tax=Dolichospermum compactum NIES-806 TaxID=1973481 RepID=A0A1Z4UXA5_9CYAN|nr:hypothetical protein [Dolichospermum compactum]BAZ83902.1 hypothetical protein NIES806_00820 [Dolichospermum compactum NIES-806]
MQSLKIKEKLNSLIEEASTVDPNLAIRLNQINLWIKDFKPGTLISKKFVMLFLQQFIRDAEIHLDIKSLASEEEQQAFYQAMTPPEKYWYSELFPKWLSNYDKNFYTWRKKLMAGDFSQEDGKLIDSIANSIRLHGGKTLQRYIVDFSMATDIIVSSTHENPLCIQLTSQSQEFSQKKSDDWENNLILWGIERGLFLSYNPGRSNFINQIVNIAIDKSDNLNIGIYQKLNL